MANCRKKNFTDYEAIQDESSPQAGPKRSQFHSGFEAEAHVITAEAFSADSWSAVEDFVRGVVREVVESKIQSHFYSFQSSSRVNESLFTPVEFSLKTHLNDNVTVETAGDDSQTSYLKLRFLNEMPSVMFTGSNIKAEDGAALQVGLFDIRNSGAVVQTGPFSSARIEIIVVKGDFNSSPPEPGEFWAASDFNRNVLPQREGKRPLLVGSDLTVFLKNGVGFIRDLKFTDNSRWTKSGKFILAARIRDNKIPNQFERVIEAISQPLKVRDQRGEVNKKNHPPNMGDEVWRLEGIGKGGAYHNRLSAHNIKTVYDFLHLYEANPSLLRQVLGNKVPKKIWKAMVDNVLECTVDCANLDFSFERSIEDNDAMKGEACKENLGVGDYHQFDPLMFINPSQTARLQGFGSSMLEGIPSLIQEASTSYHNYQNHSAGNTTANSQHHEGAWSAPVVGAGESTGPPLAAVNHDLTYIYKAHNYTL